jgi:hypothetical protein
MMARHGASTGTIGFFHNSEASGGTRDGISSAGVALRVNLFGFAVGEFDFTRPFQRPGRGGCFSQPGSGVLRKPVRLLTWRSRIPLA